MVIVRHEARPRCLMHFAGFPLAHKHEGLRYWAFHHFNRLLIGEACEEAARLTEAAPAWVVGHCQSHPAPVARNCNPC